MRLTQILGRQHLERMARKHWFVQGKKKVVETKAAECAAANGIHVVDAVESLLNPPRPKPTFDLTLFSEQALPKNTDHPDYNETPWYILTDTSALVGGLNQAQILTNTILSGSIPDVLIRNEEVSQAAHDQFQNKILLSCVFDAEQKKLPKRKDPLKPAWNFPRDLGITNARKNFLICNHITGICDFHLKLKDMAFIDNAKFDLPVEAFGKHLKFEYNADILATSSKPLPNFAESKISTPLPEIYPLHCTISIEPQHFYDVSFNNPVPNTCSFFKHAHTAFLYFDSTVVGNLYDSPVTEDQMNGRLLTKAFCIAASEALEDKKALPVTVQAIQTDGRQFSYAIYQLNTLNLEDENARNVCWISPRLSLYDNCSYVNGRPVLEGYNPDILQKTMAFLSNR